ncbi:hypothetical protein [Metabacillus niabensis]|uniref:SsrA-binding protein n=1 Tax=Metabacillus niabensis TaxID=324854 RepID=A0ABT9Z5I3_9BACI|nr:hypothetical protein [Metabacillus niabensis]MDQ0227250.1 SsrA-binding protein [Metabacillus niabensis]
MKDNLDTNLTMEMALGIALAYKKKYKLSGDIHSERNITYYKEFDDVNGPVWLVLVDIEPNDFFAENEYTIVISDKEADVKYIIDPNGHVFTPHLV